MRDDRFKRLVDAVCDHGGRLHSLLNFGSIRGQKRALVLSIAQP